MPEKPDDTIQLGDVDLNLLIPLHELLETASVTKAARHLGVTQSAVSHALKRLRTLFDDKLLVRGARGMTRTPRAEALREPLYLSLLALQDTLSNHERFVPGQSKRSFRMVMSDYMQTLILPGLIDLLSREAPGIQLQVESLVDPSKVTDRLLAGEIDLATSGPLIPLKPELSREVLFEDRLSCAVRADHPQIGEHLPLEKYLELPHILISPSGRGLGIVDQILLEMGLERHIAVRVQTFLTAPFILSGTDNLLTAPERVLRVFASSLGLRLLDPPIPLKSFEIAIVWSRREQHNPANVWLRQATIRASNELP